MHIDIAGLTVSYERAGHGPAVLLAHGFVGDAASTWDAQIEALADEFTVIAWNAPGMGSSSDPPQGFGMDDYADSLAAFLDAVGIERAHLVGLSFGAALALATYHCHRAQIISLGLVSGYAGWLGSLGPADAEQRLAQSLSASDLPAAEFANAMAPSMFSPTASGDRVDQFVDSVRATRPVGFRAMARACFEDQGHVLPEVSIPTLLLYADRDTRAPVSVGQAMHAAIRDSRLVVLKGPGHISPVEDPVGVTRELRTFLREVEQLTSSA